MTRTSIVMYGTADPPTSVTVSTARLTERVLGGRNERTLMTLSGTSIKRFAVAAVPGSVKFALHVAGPCLTDSDRVDCLA